MLKGFQCLPNRKIYVLANVCIKAAPWICKMLETKECINQQDSFKSGHLVFLCKNDFCVFFSNKYIWKFVFYFSLLWLVRFQCFLLNVVPRLFSQLHPVNTHTCAQLHTHAHPLTCFLFLPNLRQLYPINIDLAIN